MPRRQVQIWLIYIWNTLCLIFIDILNTDVGFYISWRDKKFFPIQKLEHQIETDFEKWFRKIFEWFDGRKIISSGHNLIASKLDSCLRSYFFILKIIWSKLLFFLNLHEHCFLVDEPQIHPTRPLKSYWTQHGHSTLDWAVRKA